MKPKISTGYLTPQGTKIKKPSRPLSACKPDTSLQGKDEIDDTAFQSLMNDPVKKAMIMQLLTLNKHAIKDYKKKEAQRTGSPVDKVKKKRQIESPTSLLRRRALEKLNSKGDDSSSRPSSSLSESTSSRPSSPQSEISHSLSDSPVPFGRIMAGVVAFVEIKSKDQDRSGGAKKILQAMGAKVREKFTMDVTHVVFKDGSFATYQKAKLMKVHLVSILWVEFSRKSFKKQPEKRFPAMSATYLDDNTSIICSQMHKEYEDIIRDEYRQSLMNGTPLPNTRSLIDRRRTLMTTSSTSDFQNTINSSSQEISDKEVAQINGGKEILTINSLDFLIQEPSPEIGSPLKSVENTKLLDTLENRFTTKYNVSDMELTRVNSENRPRSSFYQRPTPKIAEDGLSEQTPSLKKSYLAPTSLFDRRKTICSLILTSDDSASDKYEHISTNRPKKGKGKPQDSGLTYCSLISSDKSTNISTENVEKPKNRKEKSNKEINKTKDSDLTFCSLISSDKSTDIFAVPTKTAQKTKKSPDNSSTTSRMSVLEISDDENLQIFSRNTCKQNVNSSEKLKQSSRDMSSLNVSSEKQSLQRNQTSSSTMSLLHLSSENQLEKGISVSKKKSTDSIISTLNLSSENIKHISDNCKSLLENSISNLNKKKSDEPNSSKQSFASSDKSMRLDEDQVERVLTALQTPPSSVTVRKSSRSNNSAKFNSSINSYDSEVEMPKKKPRKISKTTKKVVKQPEETVDNQTLLNWLTEGDDQAKSNRRNVNRASVSDKPKEVSKKVETLQISSTTDDDSSPKKIRRKTVNKVKRLSKNICDPTNQGKNVPKISSKINLKDIVGICSDVRPSGRITRRMSMHQSKPENVVDNFNTNRRKTQVEMSNDVRPSTRITRNMAVLQNEPENVVDSLNTPNITKRKKIQSVYTDSESDEKFNQNRRRTNSSNGSSQERIADSKKKLIVHTDSESDTKSNSNKRRTRNHDSFLKNSNSDSKNSRSSRRNTINTQATTNIKINSATSGSESDSYNKSKSGKRKLYDPNEFVPNFSQTDDEKERQERFLEIKKRKSILSYDEDVKELAKPVDQSKDDDDSDLVDLAKALGNQSPKKKPKQQKNKRKIKTPDGSSDEQKSLLNEIMGRKARTATKQTPKKKELSPSKPISAKSYKETTKGKSPKNLGVNLFPKKTTRGDSSSDDKSSRNYLTRRSTMDFQPTTQISSSKKPKINKTRIPTIVCTKLHKSDVEVFARIVRKLGGFVVEDEVSSRTTHVVAGEPKRTINMLRAVVRGCWILKHEWLLKSLESGKWLPEEGYEVTDFAPVVQKSRLERQAFGSSYTMNIFQDCDPIYVALGTNPRCSDLRELIALCNGKVVTSHRMARIIVGEYSQEEDVICVKEIWILDCITFNKILPFKQKYLFEEKKGRKSITV